MAYVATGKPDDYVIATGVTTSVRELVIMSFAELGIKIDFKGEGMDERGMVKSCANSEFQLEKGKEVIRIDHKYKRPTEVDLLVGDASKCKKELNWFPKYSLADIVKEMVEADLKLFEREKYLKDGGHDTLNYNE